MTLIQCFGLTDGSLTSKPKMPPGYQPTFVHIYDMERLTGTGGYLMEWEQSGVPRFTDSNGFANAIFLWASGKKSSTVGVLDIMETFC